MPFVPDNFGILDESGISLIMPRVVYETNPTFPGAVADAIELLKTGAEKVSVCTVHFDSEESEYPTVVETLLTMSGTDALEDYDL